VRASHNRLDIPTPCALIEKELLSEGKCKSLEVVFVRPLYESGKRGGSMEIKELVERIVRAIVDSSEEVDVREIKGSHSEILEIKVSERNIGRVIGKKGENITAIRRIVEAAGKGRGKRYMVEVLGEWKDKRRSF
jgi:predicted RNA-binding protein YlqC (UPF0109 family)